jgi:hypothetical protein
MLIFLGSAARVGSTVGAGAVGFATTGADVAVVAGFASTAGATTGAAGFAAVETGEVAVVALTAGVATALVMILAPKLLYEIVESALFRGFKSGYIFQQAKQCISKGFQRHASAEFLVDDFYQLLFLLNC